MDPFRTHSAHDRLAALRSPAVSTSLAGKGFSGRLAVFVGGAVLALLVAIVVLVSQGSSSIVVPVASEATQSVVAPSQDVLLDGESYIAIAVDVGTFPPDLSTGDTVRVVVVPSFDSGQITRSLEELAIVRQITTPAEFGNTFVITLRAPLSVAVALADAQKVHLAVVRQAAP